MVKVITHLNATIDHLHQCLLARSISHVAQYISTGSGWKDIRKCDHRTRSLNFSKWNGSYDVVKVIILTQSLSLGFQHFVFKSNPCITCILVSLVWLHCIRNHISKWFDTGFLTANEQPGLCYHLFGHDAWLNWRWTKVWLYWKMGNTNYIYNVSCLAVLRLKAMNVEKEPVVVVPTQYPERKQRARSMH